MTSTTEELREEWRRFHDPREAARRWRVRQVLEARRRATYMRRFARTNGPDRTAEGY